MTKLGLLFCLFAVAGARAQSLGGGTVRGTVADATDAPVGSAEVDLSNSLTGYTQRTRTGPDGGFAFNNVPLNAYRLRVAYPGFAPQSTDIAVHNAVPLDLKIRLELAGQRTTVTVEGTSQNIVEPTPVPRDTIDRQLLSVLPALSADSGLNDAIVLTTAGVAADSNGFFHPLGDHAQVSYVIDGQPISDQRNKVFSTSIPPNAI